MRELKAFKFKEPQDYAIVFFTVFFTILLVVYTGQLNPIINIPGPIWKKKYNLIYMNKTLERDFIENFNNDNEKWEMKKEIIKYSIIK